MVDAHAEHPVLVERERDEALVDAATYRQMLQHALGQLHSLTSKHRQVCAQRDRLRDQLRDVPHREAA